MIGKKRSQPDKRECTNCGCVCSSPSGAPAAKPATCPDPLATAASGCSHRDSLHDLQTGLFPNRRLSQKPQLEIGCNGRVVHSSLLSQPSNNGSLSAAHPQNNSHRQLHQRPTVPPHSLPMDLTIQDFSDTASALVFFLQKGLILQQQGCLNEAMSYYHEFLRGAETITPTCAERFSNDVDHVRKCLANIYFQLGEKSAAQDLYKQILRARVEKYGNLFEPEVALIISRMGKICFDLGDYQSALGMYKQGLEIERSILPRDHLNIQITLSNIAQVCQLLGDFKSAIEALKEVLATQLRLQGPRHPNVATTLSSMAMTNMLKGEYWSALELYCDALRIRRHCLGDSHVDVAFSLNSIGLVFFKLQLHKQSLGSFLESLRIQRVAWGEMPHRDISIVLYNIATTLLELGHDDPALLYYRESHRIDMMLSHAVVTNDRGAGGTVPPPLECVARIHEQRGELCEAHAAWAEVVSLLQRPSSSSGETNNERSVATALNKMANISLQLGNTGEAMELIVTAARIARRQMSRTTSDASVVEIGLAGFHLYSFSKLHPEASPAA